MQIYNIPTIIQIDQKIKQSLNLNVNKDNNLGTMKYKENWFIIDNKNMYIYNMLFMINITI